MGNPLLPIRPHKNIESTYVKMSPNDSFFNYFETSKENVIEPIICPNTKSLSDYSVVSAANYALCAMTASYNGSNSGYWFVTRKIMLDRGGDLSLTSTSEVDSELGIVTIRKNFYDAGIINGSLSLSVTGNSAYGLDISGTYIDDGDGNLIKKSDNSVVGKVYNDEALVVVTDNTKREIATSLTSVVYKTNMQHNNISVFCKCPSDQLNFTLNHTAAATAGLYYGGMPNGHDNIYNSSSLTASTRKFIYSSDLVLSGYAFSPIITHVGLYNDENDLLAVAKLANAIKKPTDLPLTIKISIDV